MQEPQQRPRVPSPNINFIIAALLGVVSVIKLVTGVMVPIWGDLLSAAAGLVYAQLLVRDGLHIRKTGVPALPQRRMMLIGFGCLALYLAGILIARL